MRAVNPGSARSRVTRRALAVGAAALTGCLVLSACGSSGSGGENTGNGGSTQGQSGSSGGITKAKLSELKAKVEKAKQIPEWVKPGPPVDVSAVKGKTVYAFPINNEIDTCNHQVQTYAKLGKEFGMKVVTFQNSGSPTQWAQGIKNAIAQNADVLAMFCGIIPGAVSAQLQAAHNAGIKVIDGNYNGTLLKDADFKGLDAVTAVQTAAGMKTSVDSAVVALDGEPLHALVVSSGSVAQGPSAVKAVKDEVKAVCPDVCTVEKVINVPVADWTSKTEGQVNSALISNSDINAVFVAFDGMATFAVTGVQRAQRPDVHVYTWGTSASTVKTMVGQSDGILQGDAGPSVRWDAYAEMDQTIRLLAGEKPAPVEKEIVPNRFWTPDNAADFLTDNDGYDEKGYGAPEYMNKYRELWNAPTLDSWPPK